MGKRTSFDRVENERGRSWRTAEYVISYPNWGDRGRMRGSSVSAPGALHRPSCRYLSVEARLGANSPAHVYETTLGQWAADVAKSGSYTEFKVCQVCCADVDVPVTVKDDRDHIHRYDNTRAYKAHMAEVELGQAIEVERQAAAALVAASAKVEALRQKLGQAHAYSGAVGP
jgi:hypothetical protein